MASVNSADVKVSHPKELIETKQAQATYFCDHSNIFKTVDAMEALDWFFSNQVKGGGSSTGECTEILQHGPRKGQWCSVLLQVPWLRCLYHSKDVSPKWAEEMRQEHLKRCSKEKDKLLHK